MAGRQLVLYLITWQRTINENFTENDDKFEFNTYLLCVLVIFMFQYRRTIPSIARLQANNDIQSLQDKKNGEKISTEILSALIKVNNQIPIEEYAMIFFTFYTHCYQPKEHIISPYAGDLRPKNSSSFKDLDCMCVVDIFNQNSIISSNVSQSAVESFQNYCRASIHTLKSNRRVNQIKKKEKNINIGKLISFI